MQASTERPRESPSVLPSRSGSWGRKPKPGSYEAIVIGSAIYYGSWLKEATEWVRRNRAALAQYPV